jgi:DnaJ-class molecular chaperone
MADINNIFNMMFGGAMGGAFPGMQFHQGGPGIRVFHSGGGGHPGNFQEHIFHQFNKPPPIIKNVSITMQQAYHGDTIKISIEKNRQEHDEIEITIPPGIDENEVLLLRDQGHVLSDNIRGDIKITFSISNDTIFKRNGLDLIYTRHLTLKESLCGFAFDIQHLNGKHLNMNNLSNISVVKPNYKKVVSGLGFNKNGQTGNLIIELQVNFPDNLTKEQMDALKEIL